MRHLLPLLLSAIAPIFTYGQFQNRTTSTGVGYLEYLPPGYDANPTKQYPIMIFLHGQGERGNGSPAALERVKKNGPPKEIVNGHDMCFTVNGEEECFIVVAPQLSSSNNSWYGSLVHNIIDKILNSSQNYRFDPDRVYLTGLSLGGNGVWEGGYASQNSNNMFAAIAPVAAWGKTRLGCDVSARKIPVWAFHGDRDNTVTYNSGLGMFNSVANCTTPAPTAELIFTTYEGVGHNSWSRAYRTDNNLHTPNLYEWLLSKKLNSGGPTANAGPDQNITLPTNSITLNGSGTDDGSIVAYSWSKLAGPAATLTNSTTANLTASALVEGTYTFQLTVRDNDGNTASDQVTVIVSPAVVNQPPTVNAGTTITITLPTSSTNIIGTASDVDGTIATYAWTERSGPATATLTGNNTATLTASALVEGTYVFRLTVTDDDGASAFDEVNVVVNPAVVNSPPTANAGADQLINLPTNSTTLSGSGADSDGSIDTYLWEKISGPTATLTNQNTPTLQVNNLIEGIYTFRLTVTDNSGDSDSDDVVVTVLAINQNPTANAGSDITITLPTNSTTLTGSGTDPDGSIFGYLWEQVSGPSPANIINATSPTTVVNTLSAGTYILRLTVTDDDGAQDTDVVNITVLNAPVNERPTVSAGSDQSVTLPVNSVVFNGTANDPDGTIATYAWSKITGPGTFTLSGENTSTLTVSDLVAGNYTFRLTVTDNDGAQASDLVEVNVAPEIVNQAPTANAGPDRVVNLPSAGIVLNGSATDNDGTVVSYAWTKVSGPTITQGNQNTASLSLSDLVAGNYVFRLEVTDDDGATDTDEARVRVNATNQPPTASAGPDISLTLPTNAVDITGVSSDSDGTVVSVEWQQVGGTINSNVSTLSLSGLTEGTYTFRFTATDDDGASASDEVDVFVIALNQFPTVNAGPDRTITLPVNSVNITANANDPDGTIASYEWEDVSGPTATILNSTTRTVTLDDLLEGTYVFRVTVEDNDGASATDNVTVTVLPETVNTPPVANAGANRNITLPTNAINLNGSGSDPDGSIANYQWTKQSGPTATLTNDNTPVLTVSNLVEGTYFFRLTVTDNDGATAFDVTRVIVNPAIVNQAPTANAGRDIQISLPTNSTNINGSGTDNDGSIAQFLWSQLSGPSPATLAGTSTATLTASDLIEGVYFFNLRVTDDDGAVDNDAVRVTVLAAAVNDPPIANAGSDRVITLPTNSLNLVGSGSDADGSIASYAWSKLSGPVAILANTATNVLTASGLEEGTYIFELLVTDNEGATGTDNVTVQVLPEEINQPPTVNAGGDITFILPANSADVEGAASDVDGSVVSYLWTQQSGGTATLTNETAPTLQLSDLEEGIYVFRLTATDDDGAVGSDEITVTVLPANTNVAPVAEAGPDITIFAPASTATLTGVGIDDDGTIDAYAWEKVSGPTVSLVGTDQPELELSDLVEGTYIFSLTVTDNEGATGEDQVTVTVLPATTNQNPVADAGEDILVLEPVSEVTVNGSGQDPDGTIASYEWLVLSGPNNPTLANANTENVTVSGLIVGTYQVQLIVEDDQGLTDRDEMNIFVDPANPSTADPPEVDAGPDIEVQLPADSTQLVATVIGGAFVETFSWRQTAGGTAETLGIDKDTLTVFNLSSGMYTFEVSVVDNEGQVSTDDVEIMVTPESTAAMKLFSPNNDGIADFWVLNPDAEQIDECELIIFDGQGREVFQANPYENNWDGTRNGSNVPQGVYYYVLRCSGSSSNTGSGSITLIR